MSSKGLSGNGVKSPRVKRSSSAAVAPRSSRGLVDPQTLQEVNGTVKRKFWTNDSGYAWFFAIALHSPLNASYEVLTKCAALSPTLQTRF